jgi:hypothetical protein
MFGKFATSLLIVSASLPAFAQSTTGSAPTLEVPAQAPAATTGAAATSTASAPALRQQFKINAPEFGPFRLRAGIKTTETSARAYEYNDENGRRLKQKHEYYLGAVHKSGFGAYGQAVTSGTTYAGDRGSAVAGSDPSVTILHPDFYKGTSLTLSGQFRRYFAVSDRSKNRDQKQWAYYLYTTYKMPASLVVWNQATPRFFDQDFYKKGDTTYYFEDITNLTKSLSQSFALGVGQWTQVEWHDRASTGVSVDASVFARFTPIGNVMIEPRLILPAYVSNVVFDAARKAALDGARAELYAQITL